MSGYYNEDEPRRRSHRSHRPVYEDDVVETRSSRSGRQQQMELVRRRDSSSDSVEEVRREFPPGGDEYAYRRKVHRETYAPQRARSVDRHSYGYGDGYDKRSSRRDRGRRDRHESSSSRSPSPRHRERRKSIGEQALSALGLGGAAAALANRGKNKDRDERDDRARSRSRRHRRGDSSSRSRSRSKEKDTASWKQAAKAAVIAGAVEAVRSRKMPGGLPAQGKRILTAAVGAAGIDKAIDRDPDKHNTRTAIESAIGGLASNRLINGSRSRSRSRARGEKDKNSGPGLGGIASSAALAGLAFKAYNNYRDNKGEEERGRSRSRGGYESDDDYSNRPKRSKSLSDRLRDGLDKGLSKFGLGNSEYHHDQYYKDKYGNRPNEKYHPSEFSSSNSGLRGGELTEGDEKGRGTDTDSYSSDEEIGKQKKMFRKEMLTAGLATVATIHAAHNVYQSMEKRKVRHKQVLEGKMTPEEARKLKSRALLQDAASVGIAALGIKGAVSEWKEMKEQRHEYKEACHRLEEKREHRRKKMEAGEWSPHRRRITNGDFKRKSEPDMNARYQSDNPYATGVVPARY